MKRNVWLFIFLAALLIVGATCIIVPASRLTLHLLWSLILTLLSPVPVFLGRRVAMNSMNMVTDGPNAPMEAGYFMAAWMVTSAFVLPLFLDQLGWIEKRTMSVWWVPVGVVILLSSMLSYNAVFNADEEDQFIY